MHARGKVNMNEYYFINSMNELIIMKNDMNLQRFIITEYEYYIINECE